MDPNIRVGDAERDEAIRRLTAHHADGRITIEEFDDRVALALEARTVGDLQALFRDLPDGPHHAPSQTPLAVGAPQPVQYGPMRSVERREPRPFHRSSWFVWVVFMVVLFTGFRIWPLFALVGLWSWVVAPAIDGYRSAGPEPQRFHYREGDLEGEIRALLLAGRKIEAIKCWREHTGVGLAEAKTAVDAIERGRPGLGR